jgi:alginate O-acetyltransferase complex protein AlgI
VLFSSVEFIFGFLPVTVLAVMAAGALAGRRGALLVLLVASLAFYGWWKPPYLILLLVSIGANYAMGSILMRSPSRTLLALVVAFNLGLIAYFKYAQFLLNIANDTTATGWTAGDIALPLAISFFTFQQIAYQVDVYQGKVTGRSFLNYSLFVSFFPQLIAGPIVHHREIVPQYERTTVFRLELSNVWVGLVIFIIGLYKKVVIADGISVYADALFLASNVEPEFLDAWAGTLAYTFQIYFDFSGYSDMAIGLARIFGIKLPLNFHSPYKAASIIEFWQHWHMTLSRFLRDYLYIPLGGNQKGPPRRYLNVMVTMLLGGLWHGAAWTFVFWGGLHGAFLAVNHGWRWIKQRMNWARAEPGPWTRPISRVFTFLAVIVGWVFFRAETFESAISVLHGMAGLNGGLNPAAPLVEPAAFLWLGVLLLVVWFAPNTQEWMAAHDPCLEDDEHPLPASVEHARAAAASGFLWRRRVLWLVPFTATMAVLLGMIVVYRGAETADFIYMVF